ncbi:translesion error-prone DNA polymerase V subunit UmuC [Alkalimonas collagenimarina]|uniref:Translesion error-prone DNA polymerase V subunit UmuC n=1 Tax=Alkalimonas collagenimarina TaxID=400390 RepID=A0ABT9GWL0_9GAMM|nr:translesion error-prone DNA polymerase V subunit UmuC [Alkalimonas collagenimarina]MDP4535436.1 translesion error-prone DNA polymerase V subunit UmuC [Alkalimonas collagenimarina]
MHPPTSTPRCFALVDCNNFYASCERLFRPDLKQRPLVVLSNNDGCIIARCALAKQLQIPMGAPLHQVKALLKQHRVAVFSSNYALYGDLSSRVMQTLEQLAPKVEIYSIDEAFLELSGVEACQDLTDFGQHIRQTIQQQLGLPVCVGIGPSKTLAKLANHATKKYPQFAGVLDLSDVHKRLHVLARVPVHDVWGVGRKLAERLQAMEIQTALQLARACPQQIRKKFSVVLARTINELNGTACLTLDEVQEPKQQIISSRSFGQRVLDKASMQQAITLYISRAAEKLRSQHSYARQLTLFLRTSRFQSQDPFYGNSVSIHLPAPTADTRHLLQAAMPLLDQLWRNGYRYAKAGVVLSDLCEASGLQTSFFAPAPSERSEQLMALVDQLNQRQRGSVFFARQGKDGDWQMQRKFLSPAYTTRWDQLPEVN